MKSQEMETRFWLPCSCLLSPCRESPLGVATGSRGRWSGRPALLRAGLAAANVASSWNGSPFSSKEGGGQTRTRNPQSDDAPPQNQEQVNQPRSTGVGRRDSWLLAGFRGLNGEDAMKLGVGIPKGCDVNSRGRLALRAHQSTLCPASESAGGATRRRAFAGGGYDFLESSFGCPTVGAVKDIAEGAGDFGALLA